MKKYAACALIVHPTEDKILAITRGNSTLCGLPGGKAEKDEPLSETVLRELMEETGLVGDSPQLIFASDVGQDFYCATYAVVITGGTIRDSNEGHVFWATPEQLTTESPFGEYNTALQKHIGGVEGLKRFRHSFC